MNRRRHGVGVALLALASADPSRGENPHTYGTSAVSYVRVPSVAFLPPLSSSGYVTDAFSWLRWSESGGVLVAPLSLPSGARIRSLKFEFDDTNAGSSISAWLLTCQTLTENCVEHPITGAGPADCQVPGRVCSGDAFAAGLSSVGADLSPDEIDVDNLNGVYLLRVDRAPPFDASLRLAGVVVGYALQVSPAPATASFVDVPTSHPFFPFVEALGASGITGGCGGGNYCPDAPLTRGQMAVFLAKALGLQWP